MSVTVYDNRAFRQKPLVGVVSISSLEISRPQPLSEAGEYEEPGNVVYHHRTWSLGVGGGDTQISTAPCFDLSYL